jgi:hypothetical protein
METNFLEKVLNNSENLRTISVKNIDPFTHDFDSESLSDRLHSLYSVLVSDTITLKLKNILLKYKPELEFLKEVNKPTSKLKKKKLYEILNKCERIHERVSNFKNSQ